MKIRKKIIKIGKSNGIIIDKIFMDSLKLKTGGLVEISIRKWVNKK